MKKTNTQKSCDTVPLTGYILIYLGLASSALEKSFRLIYSITHLYYLETVPFIYGYTLHKNQLIPLPHPLSRRNRFVLTGSCSAVTVTVWPGRSSATGSPTARTGVTRWRAAWTRTPTPHPSATPRQEDVVIIVVSG